jgi:myosin-1
VKPNDNKQALVFEDKRVAEQGRYLGLLENLRVRRAGYCYRQTYEKWLKRYYMACKKTWPKWTGNAKDGVKAIITEFGSTEAQVQFGKTKLFIREPKAVRHLIIRN